MTTETNEQNTEASPLAIPVPGESREQANHRMGTAGASQDAIVLDNLAEQVNGANSALMAFARDGETMDALAARISAAEDFTGADPARKALNAAIAAQTTYDSEARAAANRPERDMSSDVRNPEAYISSIRDNEFQALTIQIARKHRLSKADAMGIVRAKLRADGLVKTMPRTAAAYGRLGFDPEAVPLAD